VNGKVFSQLFQAIQELEAGQGLKPSSVLFLPNPLRACFTRMLRANQKTITLAEWATTLDIPPEEGRKLADLLIEKSIFQSSKETGTYQINFSRSGHARPPRREKTENLSRDP